MGRTPATYPKTYATITGFFPPLGKNGRPSWAMPDTFLVCQTDEGRTVTLRSCQKDGGSRGRMKIGARVKMFRRPQDSEDRFRMVGR